MGRLSCAGRVFVFSVLGSSLMSVHTAHTVGGTEQWLSPEFPPRPPHRTPSLGIQTSKGCKALAAESTIKRLPEGLALIVTTNKTKHLCQSN
ncbi:hypothetical protein BaRGS_00016926 [Batillaria attramentaria]|uniref:Secreted protein n=1 Tax=Batillaria attramentaria TaxID=370345 RepID=A0ABD0KYQ6_9CAEN